MADMFFPDEDELMRQAMMNQEATQYSPPVYQPQPAMSQPGMSPYKSVENISGPDMLKSLLAQMSSPLSSQVKAPQAPTDDLSAKYAGQLKSIQDQMGMSEVTPERRAEINKGLRWQAMFADMNRNITGQPSEQLALSKELANQELNPGKDQFERMNRSLELLKNLKGMESSKHDDTLKQAMIAEQIKAIQDKRDLSDPNSSVSTANRPATKAYIGSFSSILDAFGNKGKGKSQVPGLLETSNQIGKILESVDGASAVQQKDLIDKVIDLVSKSTGLRNTELERMAVSINAGKLEHTKEHDDKEDSRKDKKQDVHITKAQEKLNKEIDDLTETLQQADMLGSSLGQVTVGPGASSVQNVLSWAGLAPEAYDRYKAKLGTFRSQYLFGMGGKALSRQELGELSPSIPKDTDPPGKQVIKLDEFKSKIERMIQRRQDEYQKINGSPIDASDVSKKADSASERIKNGESPSKVIKETYNKNSGNSTPVENPAKQSVSKSKLDAYAKQYGLSADDAAASLKKKGFNVEGY